MNEIDARRREYLQRIVREYDESSMDEYDYRRWSINHSRLALRRDLDQANRYFETVALDPRPVKWKSSVDTADWDFLGTKLLQTLLDFDASSLLSDQAKRHLKSIFTDWKQPRLNANKDNNRVSIWPGIHSENHDIMCLTIGLFGELLAGRDVREHVRQLSQSLAWRFERGWIEWNSPVYQVHYFNPLLILAEHAPSDSLRKGARDLINLQLAERALLSVNGYLGGPFFRGYDQHHNFENDRCDSYLPVMWIAFGLADSELFWGEGAPFAASAFEPDPMICALAIEAGSRPRLEYKGTRPVPDEKGSRRRIYYYNTPHISMGSMEPFVDYNYQSRFFNVMFPADPSQSLRTYLREKGTPDLYSNPRHERGELAQYRNWLISRGALVEEGGIKPKKAGAWNLYQVGQGLCAHMEVTEGWHVFQVSDLAAYPDERAFVAALSKPVKLGNHVQGNTIEGEQVSVNLEDMSLAVNGEPVEDWRDMLHDCRPMRSRYGSGRIEITTGQGTLNISNSVLLANPRNDRDNPGC